MIDRTDPEAVAKGKRETMLGINEQEFMMWRHHPVTAGFLQYMNDMIELYRTAAADLVEARMLKEHDPHVDHNPDALSGQLFMLRQLFGIELATIHAFYGKEEQEEDTLA